MSRLRLRTTAMSIAPGSSVQPYSAAWRTRYATLALEISFLLGMQAMLGQEPPIHLRSTTAVRRPACDMPSHEFANSSTAENQDMKLIRLRHGFLHPLHDLASVQTGREWPLCGGLAAIDDDGLQIGRAHV